MRRMPWLVVATLVFAACAASGSPSGAASGAASGSPIPSSSLTLSKTFTSPTYGYSIGLEEDWTVAPATLRADDPKSTDSTATDVITATGTDTTVQTLAWDLAGQSFPAWLADYRSAMTSSVPAGCDGGDPATWPAVAVGDRQGVWQQKCNAAVANVEYDGKAYQFAWENSTFTTDDHLSEADFKMLLSSVTFPQPAPLASAAP